jgi:glucosylglycerate synthase
MDSTGSSSGAAIADAPPATSTLVVGVVSYQDGETIGAVTTAVRNGLTSHFAGLDSRLVLADAASGDRTAARVRDGLAGSAHLVEVPVSPSTGDLLELPYHGIPGKARALHAVLTTARDLGARACVLFDGGVSSVTPDWVDWLARPVLDHAVDLVAPYYDRHPFEGALTKGVVYPVVRALYGVRLRQPAAAEFACSGALLDHFLAEDLWERDGAQVGVDLWLTTSAVSGDFRFGEAALGIRAHPERQGEGLDLGTTVTQVVGSLFSDLESRAARWQRTRSSIAVQRFGSVHAAAPTETSHVDPERLIESYRLGCRELRDIWTWVLPARTIVDLRKVADLPASQFRLDDELWARVVYDFALGYRLRVLPRDHLMRSLVPLYSGWLASFILQVRDASIEAVDQRVEDLCIVFELQKPYLISRWRWPERLRTDSAGRS